MGSTELTQYDKLHGVVSKLMMEHEGLHKTQISTTLALEDLGKQLHESQRQHHQEIQEMQENTQPRTGRDESTIRINGPQQNIDSRSTAVHPR